ncbi:MAG: hypothetical protein M3Z02_10450 [Actinomycetota bacterium]|nr:hypothetical protein [Actinomycetota bacterium]
MIVLAGIGLVVADPRLPPGTTIWGFRGFGVPLALTFSGTGALLALRRPGSVMGWLLAAAGLSTAAQFAAGEYAAAALTRYPGLPGGHALLWVQAWQWVWEVTLATVFLFLRFPNGQLPSPRWVRIERLSVVAVVIASTGQAIKPGLAENMEIALNPLAVNSPWALGLAALGMLLLAGSIAVSLASLVVRYQRAGAVERTQLRWLTYAAGVVLLAALPAFTFTVLPVLSRPLTKLMQVTLPLSVLAIPVAILVAVLRYRLYDIDRLISRTVSYALISGLLIAVYVSLVTVVTRLLPSSSSVAVAGSTLAVAALFQPLRHRVQAAVDHRFNRARYDAARTLEQFSARLRGQVDLASLTADLVRTVHSTFEPEQVSLWIPPLRQKVNLT